MKGGNNSLAEYEARVILAVKFITDNLARRITLEDISRAAFFSPYHFHRIFTALTGETPADFLNRLRLEKAAGMLLTNSSCSIAEIALLCGFSTQAVFSRAFKKHFGMAASLWIKEARSGEKSKKGKIVSKNGETTLLKGNYINTSVFVKNNSRRSSMKVEIKNMPARHLAYYPQMDGYDDKKISIAWEKLCNWGEANNLINQNTSFIGISFDNPYITPADKCRYYACINVDEGITPPKGFGLIDLPEGKYAVANYIGRGEGIENMWNELFGVWLPSSGFEPADSPCYDIYYQTPDMNEERNFIMDLCVPVKAMK